MDDVDRELKEYLLKGLPAFEMASIYPKDSGLDCKVWLDEFGIKRNIGHNQLRLKYGPTEDNMVAVPFFEKQDTYSYIGKLKKGKPNMKALSKWINLNYDALIKFYTDEEYSIVDFIFDMKSVN